MATAPDRDKLIDRLEYFPDTGDVYWKYKLNRSGNPIPNSRYRAGYSDPYGKGRVYLRFDGKLYLMHQIIWYMASGEWPLYIDHIDGNPANNSLSNLRSCTNQQNQGNKVKYVTNTSGYKGVSKTGKSYKASIMVNYKSISLGTYATPEAAHAAYCAAADKHFGEYANHG